MNIDPNRFFRNLPASCMMLDTELRFVDATEIYLETVNRSIDELRGVYVFDAFPESGERLALFRKAFQRALDGEANVLARQRYSIPIPVDDGGGMKEVWWDCHQAPVYADDRSVCGVIQKALDITSEVQAQEMQLLLGRELHHRVKNLFALVQALVAMSARGESDPKALAEKIRHRVAALAAAHAVSTEAGELAAVSFSDIVHNVLSPYENDNLIFDGDLPVIEIPRRAVTPVGMILHELATNAVKYGALSKDDGTVRISWTVEPSANNQKIVTVNWSETMNLSGISQSDLVPGFGSRLMRDSARQLSGEFEQSWTDKGLDTSFTFYVDKDQSDRR